MCFYTRQCFYGTQDCFFLLYFVLSFSHHSILFFICNVVWLSFSYLPSFLQSSPLPTFSLSPCLSSPPHSFFLSLHSFLLSLSPYLLPTLYWIFSSSFISANGRIDAVDKVIRDFDDMMKAKKGTFISYPNPLVPLTFLTFSVISQQCVSYVLVVIVYSHERQSRGRQRLWIMQKDRRI